MRTLRNGRKRWQLFVDYEGVCALCGDLLDGDFQIDHRIPYKLTGCSDLDNLQPVHPVCNRKKGSKMYSADDITGTRLKSTKIDDLIPGYFEGTRSRPGSYQIVKSIWEDICGGKTELSFELPPRYGKSDVARALAVIARRSGLSPYTLLVTPSRYLRLQAKNEEDLQKFATRYQVSDFYADEIKSLPKKGSYTPDKRAYLVAATLQMFVGERSEDENNVEEISNRVAIMNVIRAIQQTGQRLLVIADESHIMARGMAFGDTLKAMHEAGAIVITMTGTFLRSDNEKIFGSVTSLIDSGIKEPRYERKEKDTGEVVTEKWVDTKNQFRNEPDYKIPLRDAWDQGVLAKIDFKTIDVDGERWGANSDIEPVTLSEMPIWQVKQHLNSIIRTTVMIDLCMEMFVTELTRYKKRDGKFQGMIFAGNNYDKSDGGFDNRHCNLISRALKEKMPKWDVRVVAGDDDKASEEIDLFRHQGFDVLIVKQMGGTGLDADWIKVICDLSGVRSLPAWIQRNFRGATMHELAKVCVVISPADALAKHNHITAIRNNGGGYDTKETTSTAFIKEMPRIPTSQNDETIFWENGDWDSTTNENMSELTDLNTYRFVNDLMTSTPELRLLYSETTLAEKVQASWGNTGGIPASNQNAPVSRDLSHTRSKNRDQANEIVGQIIGKHIKKNGWTKEEGFKLYPMEWNHIKDRARIPTTISIEHLNDDDGAWTRFIQAARERLMEVSQ